MTPLYAGTVHNLVIGTVHGGTRTELHGGGAPPGVMELPSDCLAAAARGCAAPAGMDRAAELLVERHLVVLAAPPDSGRRTAGLALLGRLRPDRCLGHPGVDSLLACLPHLPGGAHLVGPLDDREAAAAPWERLAALARTADARIVAVCRSLPAAAAGHGVRLGAPEPARVLAHRLCAELGLRPGPGWRRRAAVLTGQDVARVLRVLGPAATPAETCEVADLLIRQPTVGLRAVAAALGRRRRAEAALRWTAPERTAQERALLLAVAVYERLPGGLVLDATARLLGPAEPELTDRQIDWAELGIGPLRRADAPIAFLREGVGPALLRRVWSGHPLLRPRLLAWLAHPPPGSAARIRAARAHRELTGNRRTTAPV